GRALRWAAAEGAFQISINRDGFRSCSNYGARSGDFVIACIGGSTTVNGKADNATYPFLLGRELRAATGRRARVVNCGVSALHARGYMPILDRLLSRQLPDLVVEYNGVNDICRSLFPQWRARLGWLPRLLLRSRFVELAFGDAFVPDEQTIRRDMQSQIIDSLQEVAAVLENNGVAFGVCSFVYPDPGRLSRLEYDYLNRDLRHWWRSEYISFRKYCDIVRIYNSMLRDAFRAGPALYLPLAEAAAFGPGEFYDICHMTIAGRRKKAAAVAQLIAPVLLKLR
ncbi:hypothetical protein ACFL43_06275, partial [Thermodesulfobacteriota bacterium]